MTKQTNRIDWLMKPLLRDFITKRDEIFGGYLYNPYLINPVAFSPVEMQIIELFNGQKTLSEILIELQPKMGDRDKLKSYFYTTIEKLNRLFAVKLTGGHNSASLKAFEQSSEHPLSTYANLNDDYLSAPLSVLWDITYACNLNCRHCLSQAGLAHSQELTTDEAKRVIDELADQKVFTITFCGGEPFFRKDLYELLGYASNQHMGLKISTNGTLVSEAEIKRLDPFNVFAVQVSIDGNEATHDKLRNKAGAYRQALNAVRLFVEAGYYTVVAPVVTQVNVDDMDDIIDTAASLGASAFKPSLFMPAGRGQLNVNTLALPKTRVRALMQRLTKKQIAFKDQLHIHLEAKYPTSDGNTCDYLNRYPCKKDSKIGCSAGKTQIVITATGEVVVCPFLYDFVAGSIRDHSLQHIWHTSDVLSTFRRLKQSDLKGKCQKCRYIPDHCLGGCRAAAYLYDGDIYGEDPLCWT